MSFLHRQRSLHQPYTKDITKPLPSLPPFGAIENVPREQKHVSTEPHRHGGRSLIRRVSSIFRSSPRRKAPPNLNLEQSSFNDSHKTRLSLESVNESEDDIRRPSGLGSAVSITSNRSLPPSPFTPTSKEDSAFHPTPNIGYSRIRAISSPNLLRSLSGKAKARLKGRRGSISQVALPITVPQLPMNEPQPVGVRFDFPVEVLEIILSHLIRQDIISSSTVSRRFRAASRSALYRKVDLQTLSNIQVETLVTLLASRRDLTDLVHQLKCCSWPRFFSSSSSHGRGVQFRNTRLTANFTLALQRMSNLMELTLPAFDLSLLAHHTAFGLKSLTFLNSSMSAEETVALFTWLDGQTNITSLLFPNLEDGDSNIMVANTPEVLHTTIPHHDNTLDGNTPNSSFLKPYYNASPSVSPWPSPLSITFPTSGCPPSPIGRDPFDSTTLLPSLNTLQATPSIIMSLIPSKATSLHRRLQKVSLIISTTLYTGLRPGAIMACLRGITHLSIQFCENVDKRTLEKVLGAVGAVLGSQKGCTFNREELHPPELSGWHGLESLEISFRKLSTLLPVMEEALYKTVLTTLPRYDSLQRLYLSFLSCNRYAKPLPLSPLDAVPGKVFRFPPIEQPLEDSRFTVQEQIRIVSWVKRCPSLKTISLSGTTWHNPAGQVLASPSSPSQFER